jgi:hypothetical protein
MQVTMRNLSRTTLLFLLLTSCMAFRAPNTGERGTVRIANPIGGTATASASIIDDRSAEGFYHLPVDSLRNSATLTSATAADVCLRVELHRGVNPGMPNDHLLAALNQWQVALRGGDRSSVDHRIERPQLSLTYYDGQATSADHVGTTLECTSFDHRGTCNDAAWVRHWEVERKDARFAITHGVSDVCFANEGVLTASSRSLELQLTVPGGEAPAMTFEWRFDSSAGGEQQ